MFVRTIGFNIHWKWNQKSKSMKLNRAINSAKKHFCSKFGYPNIDTWWVFAWTNSTVKFDLGDQGQSTPKLKGIFTKVHLQPEFGDSNLNLWRVFVRTNSGFTQGRTIAQTHGHTDRQTEARQYAKAKTDLWYKLVVTDVSLCTY